MNTLSRYTLIAAGVALAGFLAWYFKDILIYLVVSAIIAMIGRPIVNKLTEIKIRNFRFPRWVASALTLIILCCIILSLFMLLAPMIGEFSTLINSLNTENLGENIREPLSHINEYITKTFPSVDKNFRIETLLLSYIKGFASIDTFSNIVSSFTSIITDFSIAIFSVIFISFFLLMEKGMITNTISAFFSDSTEDKIKRTSISINKYLSRYFIGISIESLCIALLNSLGLIFIVKMDTELSIVIGFASGILNIIPYIGPLIGHILAVTMGLVYHLNGGPTLALPVYLSIILGIFIITQLIDNYLFQPIIYSNSVKAHPLEIFLVILIAGQIGGVVGIIAAIPLYTIIRVILVEFYPDKKFVKRLIGGLDQNKIG